MHRRQMLMALAGGASATVLPTPVESFGLTPTPKTKLGIVVYALGIRQRYLRSQNKASASGDPLLFLQQCHALGASGIQMPLGTLDAVDAARLRQAAEERGMFLEGIAGLPHKASEVERFEAQLATAHRAGARVVRVVMLPGRRYERFSSATEFHEFVRRGITSLELAEPVAARQGVRLAVENHKDQRIDERLDVLKHISSEYVGACVDTGNSFALLEDPGEVIRAYTPYAFSVHLKDQAVQEYADGFLFADVHLGEGFLDLQQMVDVLRKAKPDIHFSLETITRDPLKVPCLTDKYWITFANVPGRDLARTLRTVRARAADRLPAVSGLPLADQAKLEEDGVKRSLAYARDELRL